MKRVIYGLIIASVLSASSCEYLEQWGLLDEEITTEQVVEGLKKALEIGTDSAATNLSAVDGYYLGHAQYVRIPLPEEAEVVRDLITNNDLAELFNLDEQFEKVILAVNRAAEHAAKEVFPIFKNAITGMSLDEGWDILNGIVPDGTKAAGFDSTAATGFFKLRTYDNLMALYAPRINAALDIDLGLGFSAVDAWDLLTSKYNQLRNSTAVQLALLALEIAGNGINLPGNINTDLGEFSTEKALNGLFYKVGQEEIKIRRDPYAWAEEIIQKVFGYIQENYDPNYEPGSM